MKTFKKFLAVILAMTMIVAMGISAYADVPNQNNTATATVKGVEASATVMAYQITKGDYDNGFLGYVRCENITEAMLGDVIKPDPDEITSIANNISTLGLKSKQMQKQDNGDFTADLEAGYWVVVVSGTVKDVYNPMLVGAYYNQGGSSDSMVAGTVDASQPWTLNGITAHAKKSDVTVTKKIIDNANNDVQKEHGDDHAFNDVVRFEVKTTVPSYTDEYTTSSLVFNFYDTVSDGLDFLAVGADEEGTVLKNQTKLNLVVKDKDGSVVDPSKYTATISGRNLTVEFEKQFVKEYDGDLYLQYNAKMNSGAKVGFTGETNTVYVKYTNAPGTTTDSKKDQTHHYTFAIDGDIYSNMNLVHTSHEEGSDKTITRGHELIKINDQGDVAIVNKKDEESEVTYWKKDGETVTEKSATTPLPGAKFTLTNKETGKVYEATTENDGHMKFLGLDAGEYTLKETQAPAEYTLDNRTVDIKIEAKYNDDGTLKEYSVSAKENGEWVSLAKYAATYTKDEAYADDTYVTHPTKITTIDAEPGDTILNPYLFKNTKLGVLPSTGGVGTVIFSVIGSLGMIAGVAILFMNRRRVRK